MLSYKHFYSKAVKINTVSLGISFTGVGGWGGGKKTKTRNDAITNEENTTILSFSFGNIINPN